MPIHVVFNQKGGVGKSTIACNLASISASRGRRTLVIDLDPQGNSTHYLLGSEVPPDEQTLHGLFSDMLCYTLDHRPPASFVAPTPFAGLDIMASHPALEELRDKLESRYKMFKLRDALLALEGYDEVFIDTPPALNFFTRAALIATDRCLIPFDCDRFSRDALYRLMETVQELRHDHNPRLEVEGIVVNQFQGRARLPRQVVAQLESDGLPVLTPYLSASVKIRESHEHARPMVYYQPRHKLSEEFRALYDSLAR